MILQVITETPSGKRKETLMDNLSRISIFDDAVSFTQNGEFQTFEFGEKDKAAYLLNDEGKTLRKLHSFNQK